MLHVVPRVPSVGSDPQAGHGNGPRHGIGVAVWHLRYTPVELIPGQPCPQVRFLDRHTDSDFAGCPDTLRSTSGGVVSWMGAAICWNSSLQACVTLSTAESEMVALSKGAQEVIWLRRFIGELMGGKITVPTKIYCDNQATLQLIDNRVHHSRTKHNALRQNFVREHKDSNELDPQYIATTLNISDMFTKPVNKSTMDSHIPLLTGMKPIYI